MRSCATNLDEVLHDPSLQREPDSSGQVEEKPLPHQTEGHPLVEGGEHRVPVLVLLGAPGTVTLELWR